MAYVGLSISGADSEQLSGYAGARLHVTLAHLPEAVVFSDARALAADLERLAIGMRRGDAAIPCIVPLAYEEWSTTKLVVITLDPAPIGALREAVLGVLREHAIAYSRDYDYRPHISVGHAAIPKRPHAPLWPDALELVGVRTIPRWSFSLRQHRPFHG